MQIFINNEEVLCSQKMTIKEQLSNTNSVILNNVYPRSWENDKDYVSRFYMPKDYSHCVITQGNDIIFSGVVKNSGNIELNPRKPHYATLQLLDYKTFLSEGDTLNYVLEEQSVSEAIEKVVSELEGFEVGDIEIEEQQMSAYNCNEKTPYDVFEYIAEITGSIWTTTTIDENTVAINFYAVDNLPMKDDIEYTQEYFEENNIVDIKYSYSSNDYRNKQTIISENATSNITQTETVIYNGDYIETLLPISSVVSIKSGTKNYSVVSNIAKNNGTYAAFYYTVGQNSIEVNTNLQTGKVLTITYYAVVESRQVAYNQTEIDRIAESTGRNGIIARYEKREDTSDENALSQIAQTYLDYKGVPEIILTLKTHDKDIFNIGDRVFFNGPLESLKTTYLIISKQIEMITSGNEQLLFYTYKLSSSFNDENAINYFDNQRRKLEGTIVEGEYISRYIDIPSQTNIIFYDLSSSEAEIPNDILDGELDIELIGQAHTAKLEAKLEFKL